MTKVANDCGVGSCIEVAFEVSPPYSLIASMLGLASVGSALFLLGYLGCDLGGYFSWHLSNSLSLSAGGDVVAIKCSVVTRDWNWIWGRYSYRITVSMLSYLFLRIRNLPHFKIHWQARLDLLGTQ